MMTICLTSGMRLRKLAVFFNGSIRLVQNGVVYCLHELIHPLTGSFLPAANAGNIKPDTDSQIFQMQWEW
jgi:hypothetical protein